MPQIDFLPANPNDGNPSYISLHTIPSDVSGTPEVYLLVADQRGRASIYTPKCSPDISNKLRLVINGVLSVPKGWHLVCGEGTPSNRTHFVSTDALTPPPTFHAQEGEQTFLKFPDEFPFYVDAEWKLVLVK